MNKNQIKSLGAIAAISIGLGASANAAIAVVTSSAAISSGAAGTTIQMTHDSNLALTTGSFASGATSPSITTVTEANKFDLVSNDALGWNSGYGQYLANSPNQTYTYNFAGTDTIGSVLIWNYSQTAARAMDSISKVEIDTGSGFVDLSLNWTLLDAGVAELKAQEFQLGAAYANVQSIRLTGVNTDPGAFDEVAFSSVSSAAVPEPSSAALLGLGGLALILRRRK